MINIMFNGEDISALRSWRFQHPDPRVHVRLAALYWRSQGVANAEIPRRCGISKASFHRSRKTYIGGGLTPLKRLDHDRPHSELTNHRTTLAAYVHQYPPATVAEAAANMVERTGMERKPPQVRQYVRALGMKPMRVGRRPAKADVEAQEAFKKQPGA